MGAGKNINRNIINDVAGRIERLIADARAHVARSLNIAEVITKYEIGRIIVEVVQEGEERATYGKQLLQDVSDLLTERLGKRWPVETLKICQRFIKSIQPNKLDIHRLPNSEIYDSVADVCQLPQPAYKRGF